MPSVKCKDCRVKLIYFTSSDNILQVRFFQERLKLKLDRSMSCQGKGFSLDLYTLVQNLTASPAGRPEYSINCLQFLLWHHQNNPLSCGQPKFCLSCNVSHLVHNYHVVKLPSTVQTPSLCWENLQSYGSHFIRIQKTQVPDSFATGIRALGLDFASQSSLVCKQAMCGDKLGGNPRWWPWWQQRLPTIRGSQPGRFLGVQWGTAAVAISSSGRFRFMEQNGSCRFRFLPTVL